MYGLATRTSEGGVQGLSCHASLSQGCCISVIDQPSDNRVLIPLQLLGGGRAKAITGGATNTKKGLPKAPLNAIRPSSDDAVFIEVSDHAPTLPLLCYRADLERQVRLLVMWLCKSLFQQPSARPAARLRESLLAAEAFSEGTVLRSATQMQRINPTTNYVCRRARIVIWR